MIKLRIWTLAVFSLLLFGLPPLAVADPVESLKSKKMAWFFNKPNTPVETLLRDLKECNNISQLAQDRAADVSPEASNGLLNVAWTGLLGPGRTNLDVANCMASRDYRRFEVIDRSQKEFMKQLVTMEPTQVSLYFTSNTPPEGKLAEYEPNSLYQPQDNSLSASGVLPKLHPVQPLPALLKFGGPLILNKKLPPKPISTPTRRDPTKATLIARLNFDGKRGRFDRPDLLFMKRDPETGEFILTDKKRPIVFRIANHKAKHLVDGFQIFQAEPGQYALWQINGRKQSEVIYTCLSTITVDFKAGDNIYLGDWTFTSESKYGVTHNGEIEAGLALKTIQSTSGPLRPANYMNGADTPCTSIVGGGMPLYYFELP